VELGFSAGYGTLLYGCDFISILYDTPMLEPAITQKQRSLLVPIALTFLLVACGDKEAPTWPAGASLDASEVGAEALTLSWPEAIDERGVVAYVLGGDQARELAATERSVELAGLEEFAEVRVRLVAVDEAGNRSQALELSTRSADVSPPRWAEQCVVRAERLPAAEPGEGGIDTESADLKQMLRVSWCDAIDNDSVSAFVVLGPESEGEAVELGRVEGDLRHVVLAELEGAPLLRVQACDPSGNCATQSVAMPVEAKPGSAEAILEGKSILGVLGVLGGAMDDVFVDWDMGAGFGDLDAGLGGLSLEATVGDESILAAGVGAGGMGMLGGRSGDSATPRVRLKGEADSALAAHLKKKLPKLNECYQRSLSKGGMLEGVLNVRLSSAEDGAVIVEDVSGVEEDSFLSCVRRSLRGSLQDAGAISAQSYSLVLDLGMP